MQQQSQLQEQGGPSGASLKLEVKWHGRFFLVEVPATATVWEVKLQLEAQTGVVPTAQKLIGLLPRGQQPPDDFVLAALGIKSGQRCMLVGIEATRAAKMASEEEEHRARALAEGAERAERARAREAALLEERLAREDAHRREEEEARLEQQRVRRRGGLLAQRREQEQPRTEDEEGSLEIGRMQCCSSAILGNPRLDRGDKIVLPPSALEEAVNKRLASPFTFQIWKHSDHGTVSHCGALDFNAPEDMCYLPASIMAKLDLQEGDFISLRSVRLPKGEYLQLQPQLASWLDIPMATREAVLADQLRNYQTMTVGDMVTLALGSREYQFLVTKVMPPGEAMDSQSIRGQPMFGISIVDADVAVDVSEPREPYSPIVPISLDSDSPITGDLKQGSSVNYQLHLNRPQEKDLFIEVLPASQGEVDLYVSHTSENKRPSLLAYSWKAQSSGVKRLRIEAKDSLLARAAEEGWLYITVSAYSAPADQPVRYSLFCKQANGQEGRQLMDDDANGETMETKRCSHCRRAVPAASFALHEMACTRYNWWCEQCGAAFPLAEKEKHCSIAHVMAVCACGVQLPPSEMLLHKEFECPKRFVSCLYCALQVPFEHRGEHQGICGNRTVTCSICSTIQKRNMIKKHLVEEHGVYPQEVSSDHFHE